MLPAVPFFCFFGARDLVGGVKTLLYLGIPSKVEGSGEEWVLAVI